MTEGINTMCPICGSKTERYTTEGGNFELCTSCDFSIHFAGGPITIEGDGKQFEIFSNSDW